MILEDWHTHNKLCRHASGSIEDYVKSAIEKNVSTLGISDHFPYDVLNGIEGIPYQEYSMTSEEILLYMENFENCREKYQDKIDIKLAFEVDFIKNQEKNSQSILKKENVREKIDYILGSVHVLQSDDFIFAFDDKRFLEFYNRFGGIDNLYINYYKTLRKMLNSNNFDFDIVTHFDLPKKYNKRPKYKEIIDREVEETLELIKEKDKAIEINTSGLRKDVKEVYPSLDIIKKIYSLEIPITLGSDAHEPNEVAFEFLPMLKKLKNLGFSQLAHFEKRIRTFIKIK
ncbi:MAG: histidinol-phosphatase HisJ [Candidatus Lokiarchaeota archaeon]